MTAREPDEMVTAVTFPVLQRLGRALQRDGPAPRRLPDRGAHRRRPDRGRRRDRSAGGRHRGQRPARPADRGRGGGRAAAGSTPRLVGDLVALAREEIDPQPDGAGSAEYRKHLLGTLLERSLLPDAARAAA